ncbi:MraY family glycosyltransferase [Pseudomonas putida]|uniref:MraY family glycosyltransferase n=1 Tax=Pseudomonas putida TaxID=303 RepID=UPI001CD2C5FA|nr:glycosyltransferase family 4 protein [Pseudomonas putida]
MIVLLLIGIFLGSCFLTGFFRRYAIARSLLDIPNERSSHSVPTPRGGGVSIVVFFLLGLPISFLQGWIELPVMLGLIGAGLLVALIGFADDHGHIAARWRLTGHFAASAWVLFWFNGVAPIEIMGVSLASGWWGWGLGALFLVWMLNLYNFMDGIDGLASVEAISVCLSASLIYVLLGSVELVSGPLMLAAAVGGFLYWNFPPARIFMGDAGSGFLGIILGALALQAAWLEPGLIWCWIILLGVFIVDATWTLGRRLIRGEKVYQAHSTHAYQYAARRWGHKRVAMSVVVINMLFLFPVSVFVVLGFFNALVGICIAYIPLAGLAYLMSAGKSQI